MKTNSSSFEILPLELILKVSDFLTDPERDTLYGVNKDFFSQRPSSRFVLKYRLFYRRHGRKSRRLDFLVSRFYPNGILDPHIKESILILEFHSRWKCVRENPDLCFLRKSQIQRLLDEVEQYSLQFHMIIVRGVSCYSCYHVSPTFLSCTLARFLISS